jgi:membrane-associated PAP2 superfamily phosphatase
MNASDSPNERPRSPRPVSGPPILVPVLVLLVATAAVRMFDLDLRLTRLAFDGTGWPWNQNGFIQLMYDYGTWPAITMASIAGAVWIGSAFIKEFRGNRTLAMFVALSMVVGPGLLVNALFKEYYGRPRPREVIEFGGQREVAPVLQPNIGQGGKSCPSGHASMGFFWLTLAVFHTERNRRLAAAFALLALVHGGCMGFGRIVQGGHWFSDVVWAAGMDYLAAWFLYRALRLSPAYSRPVPDVREPTGP